MEADTASTLEPSRTYQKHFIPLESNPEIFTALIHKLGVSESLEFQDVLSLDDPDLLAFLPRPVHALILVFLTSEQYEARVTEEDSGLEEGQPHGDVLFFKQTINNACGLYAILHAVCNGEARCKITSGSTADNLQQNATSLDLESCALALEADPALEQAYGEVALDGDTAAPDNPEDEVDYHYICFVKSHKNGHLYQLDGDRKQPIDLGTMEIGDDVLSERCLHVIRSMIESEDGNVNFSLMALVPTGV